MTSPADGRHPAEDGGAYGEAVRLSTLAGAASATLLAAAWVREPRVSYLAGAAVATALGLAIAWRRRTARVWMLLFAVSAVTFAAPALWTQRGVAAIDASWERTRAARLAETDTLYVESLRDALDALDAAARRALVATDSSEASFRALEPLAHGGLGERAVVVLRDTVPVAWAGALRVPLDSLRDAVGLVSTTFHTVLYVGARDGNRRAVATELVSAAPPATSVARALDTALVTQTVGWRAAVVRASAAASLGGGARVVSWRGRPLLAVRAESPERLELRTRLVDRGRAQAVPALAFMVLVLVAAAWYHPRGGPAPLTRRLIALGVPLVAIEIVPLSLLSNASRLFDPLIFYAPHGGGFTGSAGALMLTGAIALLALFAVLRSGRPIASRGVAALVVLGTSGVAPFVLRDLARGITPPTVGLGVGLWVAWQLALFLPAVALIIAGATAGRAALGTSRGVPPFVAPALGAVAAIAGPLLWHAPAGWPQWYPLLWIAAVGALALMRRTRLVVLAASVVAGLGAATLVWGAVARQRVDLARSDVRGLASPDPEVERLLERFARRLADAPPTSAEALLARYASSPLVGADVPVLLESWLPREAGDSVAAALSTVRRGGENALSVDSLGMRTLVATVRESGEAAVATVPGTPGLAEVLAVPHGDGRVTSVAVFSRTRLLRESEVTPLLGLQSHAVGEPPYNISLLERLPTDTVGARLDTMSWTREGSEIHGDWLVALAGRFARAHVEVELRPFDVLVQRGILLVLLDVLVVGALWSLPVAADGTLSRRFRAWRSAWLRSYRSRLSIALFGFFVVPAAAFAIWSYRQLQRSDVEGRRLLARETLFAAAAEAPNTDADRLAALGARLGTPLLVYEGGVLRRASDPLLQSLAPGGLLLPPEQELTVALGEEPSSTRVQRIGRSETLFGYEAAVGDAGQRLVVAAPARADDMSLDQRRRDLGFLVLLVAAGGALAALWLSGLAANELARPVGALREAALAIAGGEREPALSAEPPTEFGPVFTAFRRMAADLSESRSALEAAQRRTAAVLRNVASGVLAVRRDGRVTIANPRAESLLGTALPSGATLEEIAPPMLAARLRAFLAADAALGDEEFDLELHGLQLRARLTRLPSRMTPGRGGDEGAAVLTLDDLTELARAQRVLAWGEMARQVAHEIKNPLTPIRLGMQHLRRAYFDRRGNFDEILERNVQRVLEEIDRLDEIARAFSRYGTAPAQRAPGVPTDVAAVARDVVALERMGQGTLAWEVDGADAPVVAIARDDELREVLLNLLENARHAQARTVRVVVRATSADVQLEVHDDGEGIPDELQARVFEPHFSTRTSGSGLGLAISRRLIEGWGGTIALTSRRGVGTSIVVTLRAATDAP